MRQRLTSRAISLWVRKAKLLSLVSDLTSLHCRVLIKLPGAPQFVGVSNLDPGKFMRAYYMRERSSLRTWRRVAKRKIDLRHSSMLVGARRRRFLALRCLRAWRDVSEMWVSDGSDHSLQSDEGSYVCEGEESLLELSTQFSHRSSHGMLSTNADEEEVDEVADDEGGEDADSGSDGEGSQPP